MNSFINELTYKSTRTENGAISHGSTGNIFLDQFAKAGTYRDREQSVVDADMVKLWNENPTLAIQFCFYLRAVTRKNKGVYKTETVVKGQGLKDESMKRLLWVARNHPEAFAKNILLIPEAGYWKDLIVLWEMDSKAVSTDLIFGLMQAVLELEEGEGMHTGNIKKYIPTLRSRSNRTSPRKKRLYTFVKAFMKYFEMTQDQYKKFKKSGTSHEFQRLMCARAYGKIDFKKIAGRALFNLVNKKSKKDQKTFIERHGLEKSYLKWISGQPVAKFTGYVYELMSVIKVDYGAKLSPAKTMTVNKQFDGLIATAKADNGGIKGNVWCALDTSGSMNCQVANTTAYDIAVSLGVYFSALNEGSFKDHVIMFDSKSTKMKLAGTFVDKVTQIKKANTAWGGTNFQSVIDEIVSIRKKNPNIPLSDFPETLLVVSDLQFNSSGNKKTNHEKAMKKLAKVGLPNITIIWWQVNGRSTDFPSRFDDENTMQISGFDGAILTLLLGGDEIIDAKTGEKRKPNPVEAMMIALNQELLTYVQI